MAIRDLFASRLAAPAGRVLDAPIRDIVHEILREHGYASPAEVQALRDELRDLRARVDSVDRRVAELSTIAEGARTEAAAARAEAAVRPTPVAPAPVAPTPVDNARTAALEARVSELEAALTIALAPAPAGPLVTDPLVLALETRVLELEAALAARAAAPQAVAAPQAAVPAAQPAVAAPVVPTEPLSAEPRAGCKVADCAEAVRSKGFCSPHYQQWRRGTLKGFVNADGTALVDGRVVHLATDAIGAGVTLRDGRLFVDGKLTKEVSAPS
ncbi:MAG: hypothetical protein Q8P18_22675 [Pseudomonadota bacterium]|nr:hypothetical protein [Pseudomonadota bacterium]